MGIWRPTWTFPWISTTIAVGFLVLVVISAVGLQTCLGLDCAGNAIVLVGAATVALGFSFPFWVWLVERKKADRNE